MREGVRSSGGEGKEGVVRRPPAVKLLPLRWGRPRRRRRLPPAGRRDAAASFLHLAQRRGAGRRGPAVAAVEAEVVLRHGPSPEPEGGRRRGTGVSVSGVSVAVVVSGSPLGLQGALISTGVPSPSWVVPDERGKWNNFGNDQTLARAAPISKSRKSIFISRTMADPFPSDRGWVWPRVEIYLHSQSGSIALNVSFVHSRLSQLFLLQ